MAITQFVFGVVSDDILVMYAGGAVAETKVPGAGNGTTTAAATASQAACRVATDIAVYVSFGAAPDASTDANRFLIPASRDAIFRVKSGDKGAVILA